MTLLKARSYRSVLKTGFRLYMEQFRSFFKKSWLTALVLAILYGTFGALMLLMKPNSMAAAIVLFCMPFALPVIYALVRRVLKLHRDYWLAPRGGWKMRLRNIGLILIVLFLHDGADLLHLRADGFRAVLCQPAAVGALLLCVWLHTGTRGKAEEPAEPDSVKTYNDRL